MLYKSREALHAIHSLNMTLGVFYKVYGVDQLFLGLFSKLNFSSLELPSYTPGVSESELKIDSCILTK